MLLQASRPPASLQQVYSVIHAYAFHISSGEHVLMPVKFLAELAAPALGLPSLHMCTRCNSSMHPEERVLASKNRAAKTRLLHQHTKTVAEHTAGSHLDIVAHVHSPEGLFMYMHTGMQLPLRADVTEVQSSHVAACQLIRQACVISIVSPAWSAQIMKFKQIKLGSYRLLSQSK